MERETGTAERRTARTERDCFWLGHLKRLAAEGIEAKAYAAREKLSVQALYQGKKRLVALGAWPRSEAHPPFDRVRVAGDSAPRVSAPASADPALRLRLPGGGVLEWRTPPAAEWLAELALRLGRKRSRLGVLPPSRAAM